jgi:photosystem II stability/assembly factor-like uncharacterized protein
MKKIFLLIVFLFLTLSVNAQWVEQTSGVTTSLRSISAVNSNVVWISGNTGVVLRTTDSGTNWTSVGGGAIGTSSCHNIFAVSENTAFVCANPASGGFVYRTTDGGTTWVEVLSQTGGFFNGVKMTSPTNGFLTGDPVGGRWSNFRTTDGGATWDSTGLFLAQNGTEAGWNNSLLVNGSKIYFGTNNSRIYYSSDNGTTWTFQTMPLTNSFGIWFNSDLKGIVGGSTQGLVSTTDGGTTWNAMTSLGTGTIYSIIGNGSLWYHTRGTRIFVSTDDGATWDTSYTAVAGTFNALLPPGNGEDVAWGIRSNGGITKGTPLGLPVELASFTAKVNPVGHAVLNWVTASEINNSGFEIERRAINEQFAKIGFVEGYGTTSEEKSYSYVDKNINTGTNYYRLKQVDFDGTFQYSKEIELDVTSPLSFGLEQNYPNPFNPNTNIKFSLAIAGNVKLTIFNTLGEEIGVLVNGYKDAGFFEVNFDAANLPSGTYIYRLETPGYFEAKKMILIK